MTTEWQVVFLLRAFSLRHFDVSRILFACMVSAGNTKGGITTVPLTSCLTGLESAV